jgi:hypothetical protein
LNPPIYYLHHQTQFSIFPCFIIIINVFSLLTALYALGHFLAEAPWMLHLRPAKDEIEEENEEIANENERNFPFKQKKDHISQKLK